MSESTSPARPSPGDQLTELEERARLFQDYAVMAGGLFMLARTLAASPTVENLEAACQGAREVQTALHDPTNAKLITIQ